MKKICGSVILLFIIFNSACHDIKPEEKTVVKKRAKPKIFSALSDSTRIGEPGRFKIKIHQTRYSADSSTAFFEFYYLSDDGWKFKQSHEMPVASIMPLHTLVQDYNGDGKGDLSFNSAMANRSNNDLRTLFLYRDSNLVRIVNSDKYPNLQYNSKLDCIDSWILHKGSSTAFLKVVHDSLVPFATVSLMDTLLTVVENGKIISQKRIEKKDLYMRYKSYKPLITSGEYKYAKDLVEHGLKMKEK